MNVTNRQFQLVRIPTGPLTRDCFRLERVVMPGWVEDGRLKMIEDVVEGFESLPDALIALLRGRSRGKRMVNIG
jgi:NADPH-dependent curcumin reductase CurA